MDKILIYVLLLTDNCYYIGKTTKTVEGRFKEHLIGSAAWTTLQKPLKIIETLTLINPMDEDIITKKYMLKYGIENVRGGTYIQIELTENQIKSINDELRGAMDECLKCGKKGHFASECVYYKQNKNSLVVPSHDEYEDDDGDGWVTDSDSENDSESDDNGNRISYICDRCGKTMKDECYYYEHISVCTVGKGNTCFRCGRKGHYATNCYAKSHVKGYYLHSN